MGDSPSASRRTFAIPELVERILLFLLDDLVPPTNREDLRSDSVQSNARILLHLLCCSQVGRLWYQCVFRGSKAIRRALFLYPENESNRSWNQHPVVYPSQQSYYRGLAFRAPILNPMIQTAFAGYRFRYWRSGLGAEGPRHHAYLILTRRHIEYAQKLICLGYGKDIRDMFLSQPPPTELCATIWERDDELKNFSDRTTTIQYPSLQNDSGVTLGDVLKKAGQIFQECDDVTSIKVTTV